MKPGVELLVDIAWEHDCLGMLIMGMLIMGMLITSHNLYYVKLAM